MDAGLLPHFASHRRFERLAWLDESREARESGAWSLTVAPEQRTLAADHEHDHDGIRARKVRRATIGTAPDPAGRDHSTGRATLRAETMPRVPIQERARLGEDGRLALCNRRRERAHVDQLRADVGESLHSCRIDRKARTAVTDAEKDQHGAGFDPPTPRRHGLPVE